MSFINQLAKGFVRSAVNQVGRDGGRVISNKVYGNRHAAPIRMTGGDVGTMEAPPLPDGYMIRDDLYKNGYKEELMSSRFWTYFFMIIGSFLLPIIRTIYWIITSVKYFRKQETTFFRYDSVPVMKADRRYKTGVRVDGYQQVKAYAPNTVPAIQSERNVYLLKGFLALVIALLTVAPGISVMFEDDKPETTPQVTTEQVEQAPTPQAP